jgi:hypothetical protein
MRASKRQSATQVVAAAFFLLIALVVAGGCSQTPSPAKSAPDGGTPSLAEALAAFEESEDELQALLRASGAGKTAGEPSADAPAQPAPPPVAGQQQSESELSATKRYATRRNRCDMACDALGSMQRSAERLCEMAGEDDSRCGRVRERVRAARQTVRDACPACTAAGSE